MKLYIPAWQFRGSAIVHRVKGWSPLEEAILLSLFHSPGTIDSVSNDLALPLRIVSASIFRLMRFGLVDLRSEPNRCFEPSVSGREFVSMNRELPEQSTSRSIGFNYVFETLGGSILKRWDVEVAFPNQLSPTGNVKLIDFPEGDETEVSMSSKIADHFEKTLRPGEWLRGVETVGAVLRRCYVGIEMNDIRDGIFPDGASDYLKSAVSEFETTSVLPSINIIKHVEKEVSFHATVDQEDVLLSSEDHLVAFERIVASAKSEIFVLSTFIADFENLNGLAERERVYRALVEACKRGVRCHLFFGTSRKGGEENGIRLLRLRDELDNRSQTRGRLIPHLESVGSHSKFVIADDGGDGAVAIFGSCNWLSSGFRPIEMSVVLHSSHVVAALADLLSTIVSSVSTTVRSTQALHAMVRHLRRERRTLGLDDTDAEKTNACLTLIRAQEHDHMLRSAAHSSKRRFICASNKFGANLVIGVLNAAEEAAGAGKDVRVFYATTSGPLNNDHAEQHIDRLQGTVDIVRLKSPAVHAKFLLWDDDDIIVSSLNWASQNSSIDAPVDELGVHIRCDGLATAVLGRFEELYSKVLDQYRA